MLHVRYASAVWTQRTGKHNASTFSTPSPVKLNCGLKPTIGGLGSHEKAIILLSIEMPQLDQSHKVSEFLKKKKKINTI